MSEPALSTHRVEPASLAPAPHRAEAPGSPAGAGQGPRDRYPGNGLAQFGTQQQRSSTDQEPLATALHRSKHRSNDPANAFLSAFNPAPHPLWQNEQTNCSTYVTNRTQPMDHATLDALNRATSTQLYHLSNIIERLMSDPKRIMQVRIALHLGQEVRFVDWSAPGVELQFRRGTVVVMKDKQVGVKDAISGQVWMLPYAAIEIPEGSPNKAPEPEPKIVRPGRDDFQKGDRVSFEDSHLQTCIGTIIRINQKTASIEADDGRGWRVSFGLLRHIVDI